MEDSPSRPSVAELTGRFRGQVLPTPDTSAEPSFRRKAPSSLKLRRNEDEEPDRPLVSPNRFKVKTRSSPLIEKLQANLALSPTALLPPSPRTAEVRSPTSPCSAPRLLEQSSEEEDEENPVSFDSPPEGAPLASFNKTRARLSFKRRLPSRRHRRSSGGDSTDTPSCDLNSPLENGEPGSGFDSPEEECEEPPVAVRADEEERDCEATEKEETNQGEEKSEISMEDQPSGRNEEEKKEVVEEEEKEEVMEEENPEEPQEEVSGCVQENPTGCEL